MLAPALNVLSLSAVGAASRISLEIIAISARMDFIFRMEAAGSAA